MTMHMVHPSLSMGGKRKGKIKFRNAEEAKRARQLDAEWQDLQKRWGVDADSKRRTRALNAEPLTYNLSAPVGRTTTNIPSRDTGHLGAIASKPTQQYTGTKMLGISQMSKSNAVPVFTKEEIVEIGKMRRG